MAETVRSHPRPGSNSNGNLVTAFHATQDPISRPISPAMGKEESGSIAVAYALRKDPGGTGQGHNTNYVPDAQTVRRLTPTECERLQGLPDGWTDPHGNAPDSRRYAALGDAVTAPVAQWIGERIIEADRTPERGTSDSKKVGLL